MTKNEAVMAEQQRPKKKDPTNQPSKQKQIEYIRKTIQLKTLRRECSLFYICKANENNF